MDLTRIPEYVMNTLCRICAKKCSKLTPIFEDETLAQKINKCLSIKVTITDNLPLNVCDFCFYKINNSYLLYEVANQSDKNLKKLWKILLKETGHCSLKNISTIGQDKIDCNFSNNFNDINILRTNDTITEDVTQFKESVEISDKVCVTKPAVDEFGKKGFFTVVCNKNVITNSNLSDKLLNEPENSLSVKYNDDNQRKFQDSLDKTQNKEFKEVSNNNKLDKCDKIDNKDSEKRLYQCQFCSCQLTSVSSLNIHESTHSQQKPYLCDVCGKSFRHLNNLKCHKKIHMGTKKLHTCKICKKTFLSNFFLQEHMNTHTGKMPYKCLVCNKEFREKVHLRQHKWTHSEEKFTCNICGKKFNRKGNMNKHKKIYHQNNSLEKQSNILNDSASLEKIFCPICKASFSEQLLLKTHIKVFHKDQKTFSCLLCGKKFRHSGSLTYHRRAAHTGEKPFQCNYCDKKFSLRSVQLIHERKNHTFEHPFKCTFCEKLFTNSSTLKNHLYVHSKIKLFQCEECGKKFSRNSSLLVHKKIHSCERNYICDDCGKAYIQKYDLIKHKKIHDYKNKRFFCKYCGNHFSRKTDVAKHLTCQYNISRKINKEIDEAEKILDSVSKSFLIQEPYSLGSKEIVLENKIFKEK